MKKFILLTITALLSVVVMAQDQRSLLKVQPLERPALQASAYVKTHKANPSHMNRIARAESAGALVTVPENATVETYYVQSGYFYLNTSNGMSDYTSSMPSVQVAFNGSDIYIQGLAYWFSEAWIKGTLDGTTATFPTGQLVGEDEYGTEYIVGSSDGQTLSDIIFEYNSTDGVLTAVTPLIVESSKVDAVSAYAYWSSPVFSKEEPVAPEAVTLPEGVELVEYSMSYSDADDNITTKSAAVAVDGNDVYFQGFSSYIPDALMKGTKDGNTITFPVQYLGTYSDKYKCYLYEEAVFTYNPEDESYTAQGHVYSVLNDMYYDVNAYNPVLTKVVEKAAMPANPTITGIEESDFGFIVDFNIPVVDVDGNGLVTSKLYFILYSDVEGEVNPIIFTPDTHSELTESMTEIPYGFTENYDFYLDYIYLNALYSADWNKIGIQSIYVGGGVENVTEIQWLTLKPYAIEIALEELKAEIDKAQDLLTLGYENGVDELNAAIAAATAVYNSEATVDEVNAAIAALQAAEEAFEAANVDADAIIATWVAKDQGYDNAEVVNAFDIDDSLSATVAVNSGTTEPKYYATGNALRLYGQNTLTITGKNENIEIKKIVLTFASANNAAVTENYPSGLQTDVETYTLQDTKGVWVGSASAVTFTNPNPSGHARIQAIDVTYAINETVGINTIDTEAVSTRYFDLQGRVAGKDGKGLVIKQITDAQGTVKTVKVVR